MQPVTYRNSAEQLQIRETLCSVGEGLYGPELAQRLHVLYELNGSFEDPLKLRTAAVVRSVVLASRYPRHA